MAFFGGLGILFPQMHASCMPCQYTRARSDCPCEALPSPAPRWPRASTRDKTREHVRSVYPCEAHPPPQRTGHALTGEATRTMGDAGSAGAASEGPPRGTCARATEQASVPVRHAVAGGGFVVASSCCDRERSGASRHGEAATAARRRSVCLDQGSGRGHARQADASRTSRRALI
jgi:hypothetical protein